MNSILEKKENNKAVFTTEIESGAFNKAINEVYMKNKQYFNVPGFRKGKVPRQIIELNYGKEIFYEEALNICLDDVYREAIEELELDPVGMPEVDIDGEIVKGENITIRMEVAVRPEVTLGEYKGLEIEKAKSEVSEEDVEKQIESVREMNARIVPVEDRKSQEGDVLDINFKGFVDGEAFEGGEAENYELELGSNTFIPGFEEQLFAKEKDEEVEVNVVFPEDYQEDLAGKDAKFEVKINEIKVKELPELDDEFVIDVSEFDTVDEYREDIRKNLEKQVEEQSKGMNENNIIDKVVENSEMEIPEEMIDVEVENELNDFAYRLQMQGLGMEQYLQMTGSDVEGFKEQIRPVAIKRIESELVLDAIVEKEAIEVTEEDIDEELDRVAEQYGQEDVEKFKEDMRQRGLDYMYKGLGRQKAVDFLMENTKFI